MAASSWQGELNLGASDTKTFCSPLMTEETWRLISQSVEGIIGRTHPLIGSTLGSKETWRMMRARSLWWCHTKEVSGLLMFWLWLFGKTTRLHRIYTLTTRKLLFISHCFKMLRWERLKKKKNCCWPWVLSLWVSEITQTVTVASATAIERCDMFQFCSRYLC